MKIWNLFQLSIIPWAQYHILNRFTNKLRRQLFWTSCSHISYLKLYLKHSLRGLDRYCSRQSIDSHSQLQIHFLQDLAVLLSAFYVPPIHLKHFAWFFYWPSLCYFPFAPSFFSFFPQFSVSFHFLAFAPNIHLWLSFLPLCLLFLTIPLTFQINSTSSGIPASVSPLFLQPKLPVWLSSQQWCDTNFYPPPGVSLCNCLFLVSVAFPDLRSESVRQMFCGLRQFSHFAV